MAKAVIRDAVLDDAAALGRVHVRSWQAVCVESLRELGYAEAILWVATENRRARRFYEREGWHFDGASKVEVMEGVEVSEVRYCRLLRSE